MAKKKKTPSINLLRGIKGSKLAALVTLAIILLAVPLTVINVQKQQQTQHEAANRCVSAGGSCINTDFSNVVSRCLKSGKKIVSGLCPGPANIKCCLYPTPTPKTKVKKTCGDLKGRCLDLNKYRCNVTVSGLCPGGSNIKCCVGNYWRK